MPRGHLDATPLVGRRMLDKCDETGGHEPAGTHDLPGPRHFTHLHDATRRDNFNPAPGARGDNVERLDTTVTVRQAGDISWHNDDLGPVNTLGIGEGTCEWGPQGLGTFFKTATVTFSGTWEGSQCIIGRQVAGMGELFVANQATAPVTLTGLDYGTSGKFCAPGGGCPVEVKVLLGRFEGAPALTFPHVLGIGQADEIQIVLRVDPDYASPGATYSDLKIGFIGK
jgi:hypothetical protein